uniref:Tudor domain-containing protein n=1 Tax=Graphocephala atropunctata TaxID=36148 RepID=A0A1B6KJB9_9HEMI
MMSIIPQAKKHTKTIPPYSKDSQSDSNSSSSGCEKETVLDVRLDGASKEFMPKFSTQRQHHPTPRQKSTPRMGKVGYSPNVNRDFLEHGYIPPYPLQSVAYGPPPGLGLPIPWYEGPMLQHTPAWPGPPTYPSWHPPGNMPSLSPAITDPAQNPWSSGDEQYLNSNSDGSEESMKIENINNINVNVNVMAPEFVPRTSKEKKYPEEQRTGAEISRDIPSILPASSGAVAHVELKKPRTLFKSGENLLVLIAHLESPAEFYIHFLTSNNTLIDKLRDQMTNHYNLKHQPEVYSSWREAKHTLGKFCACKWKQDSHWYRVEVIDWAIGGNQVKVFFVDFGNTDLVPLSCLQPLSQDFGKLPMCAQRCHLAQVHPLMKDQPWSRESVDFFKSKVQELDYNTRVYSITVVPSNDNKNQSNSLSVMLYEGKATDDSSSINDQMVDRGFAWSKRLLSQQLSTEGSDTYKSLDKLSVLSDIANMKTEKAVKPLPTKSLELSLDFDLNTELNVATVSKEDDKWENWDPREEDYRGVHNNPALDSSSAGVALIGYSAQDEKRICKFFSSKGVCWKTNCPKEHSKRYKDGVTTDKEAVHWRSICKMSLPTTGEEISVRVTAVDSLSCFYVQLEENKAVSCDVEEDEDKENLTLLHKFINENVQEMRYLAVPPALGQLVIAKYEEEWFRARVISADDDPEVMFVDYGSVASISAINLREMEPRYLHLPFQAIECSLANIVPSDDSELYKKGTDQLKELILGSVLTAKVYDREENTDDVGRLRILLQLDSGIDVGEWLIGINVCKPQLCLPFHL